MMKKNWMKAKASPGKFAANMGTPSHRRARTASAGMKMKGSKKGKGY